MGNQTVAYFGTDTTFLDWGLDGNSFYFYSVFAAKTTTCVNGIRYRNYKPLQGYANTSSTTYQPYYGTLHSHSELSDGAGTVSGNLAFANAALCMDYSGISDDYNHTSAGMTLSNWNQGVAMAKTASIHLLRVVWYGVGSDIRGMDVLVYGTDSLMGWTRTDQIYVPQNTYVGAGGLFEKVTTVNTNTFAMLAHPNSGDFNDVATVYDATADLALTGCAVENGPSTSVDTTYSDNPNLNGLLNFLPQYVGKRLSLRPNHRSRQSQYYAWTYGINQNGCLV